MKKLLFYASAVAVLFSSCSKDATEDVAISNVGNKVFSASISVEDEEKTRMGINDEDKYEWDINDAIGVASKAAPDANILVNNTVEGMVPSFAVSNEDLERWLGIAENVEEANPMYVYFPYMPGTKFVDGKVNLTIPAEQRYAEDSFYRNTVPAVGYVEKYSGADQTVPLYIPVSMLRVNVCGFGDAEKITLKIETPSSVQKNNDAVQKNASFYQLAGSAYVDIVPVKDEKYAPAFTFNGITFDSNSSASTPGASNEITVTFGNVPEELKYNPDAAFPVHFVIPAGLDLSEARLYFELIEDGSVTDSFIFNMPRVNPNKPDALKTQPNGRLIMESANVIFGMKDKLVMSNEEQFLVWAYLNSGLNKDKLISARDNAKYVFGLGNDADMQTLTPLIIADELNFADYGKTWADEKLKNYDNEDFASPAVILWHDVLTWYKNNNYQIVSLKAASDGKPALYGYSGETPVVIKNLNVYGEGITANVALKNLKFENVTVNAVLTTTKDGKTEYVSKTQKKNVGFIAAKNAAATIENVVIGEGNVVNAHEATTVGGIYATVSSDKNLLKEAAAITINVAEKSKTYEGPETIGALYATVSSALNIKTAGYELSTSQAKLPLIGKTTDNKANIVAEGALSSTAINAGIVGKVEGTAYVIVDEVSYWNGKTVIDDGKAPFTAEELAQAWLSSAAANIVLTNDIDMQASHKFVATYDNHKDVTNTVNSTETEESTAKNPIYNQFEIKNVVANAYVSVDKTEVDALFGNANVANVKLSNIVLNVAGLENVAGVAVEGSAKNVDVDGLTINVDKAVTVGHIKSIGGVLASADVDDIDDVNVKSISIVYGGTKVLGARAGLIAGTLNIEPNSEAKLKAFSCGAKTHTFTNLISNQTDKADKNGSYYTVYATDNNYADALPFGTISVNNAAVNKNGNTKAYLKLTEANFGSMTRLAAGVVFSFSDDDLALLKAKTKVGHDATAIDTYKYVFISDGKIGMSQTVFGFTAK